MQQVEINVIRNRNILLNSKMQKRFYNNFYYQMRERVLS